MSAFNWIVIEATCPSCRRVSSLRAQTHVASDYSGDASGRFHDRQYRLGESMAWWPTSDPRYVGWRANAAPVQGIGSASEACYTDCLSCGAKLYAVIEFESLTPKRVADIGVEQEWPKGYAK